MTCASCQRIADLTRRNRKTRDILQDQSNMTPSAVANYQADYQASTQQLWWAKWPTKWNGAPDLKRTIR